MKIVTVKHVRIYINPNMTIARETIVERSLKERFLTFPWRPLDRYRKVISETPYQNAMAMNVNGAPALMMHPATFDRFKQQLPSGSVHEAESETRKKEREVAMAHDNHERHHRRGQH